MRAIKPLQQPTHVDVCVPGSKSYTHRMLIAAALSDGACTIQDALDSEDTTLTLAALSKWGVAVERSGSAVAVTGRGGALTACRDAIFLGNSGTSMRLLTAVAALARGTTIDGLSMFVHQGARQFELWTGLKAPVDIMRMAVEAELAAS